MFRAIARFSVRFRYLVVLAWIVAVPLVVRSLPSLSSVSQSGNTTFLPANAPVMKAAKLAAPFEGKGVATSVIVAVRASGPLTAADNAAMTRVEQAAARVPDVGLVRDQGISGDGRARQALVAVSGAVGVGTKVETVVEAIRATFGRVGAPPGLAFHLTGQLAESVDANKSFTHTQSATQRLSILFILVLLLIVFRSALAPLVTLAPVVLSLAIAGPVIAEASKAGVDVSQITQILLIVLLLGAGTDYGLFLVFRVREELRRGLAPKEAVVEAMTRVGESISYSAATVIAALLSLLLASFGLYRGLGPGLAIGLGVMLLAALTFLPALLAILGRAAFWPSRVRPGTVATGLWGRVAGRIVQRPVPTLVAGVVLFGGLAFGIIGYKAAGFSDSGPPAGSDSAIGAAVLAAHFPAASNNPENLLLRFPTSVWSNLPAAERAQRELTASAVFRAVSGPFDPNGTLLTPAQLAELHAKLGPAVALPPVPPAGSPVPPALYNAYRATAQFISPDGSTVQFYGVLRAGATGTTQAMQAIPQVRAELTAVGRSVGASDTGVAGQDAGAYDVSRISTQDLQRIVPVVLVVIGLLLALLLRSLVAPWYLIVSVGLSYLASLGLANIVFVHIGGDPGLNFVLPFLMFVFSMALGEDYNILVMSRIREEAHDDVTLRQAVAKALGFTGGTVTSAGLILAGTFAVLGASGTGQLRQIGFGIAAGVLLDTFFVRTLLVPSIVVLVDRWNWWPSRLWRRQVSLPPGGAPAEEVPA